MPSSKTSTALRSGPTSGRSFRKGRPTPAAPEPALLAPDQALVERFSADLGRIAPADARLGIAVSGGPDSIALLLLAAAARPGRIEAATVDHALRPGSRDEPEMVGAVCAQLGVRHAVLTAEWAQKPATAIQERARCERYRLLAQWLSERRLAALVTAHHLNDQAETLLMRLNRGSGVRGLAGMRAAAVLPAASCDLPLLRPLLGWRRCELQSICNAAGVDAIEDPSNADERFERVRIRRAIAAAEWLDAQAISRSAAHLTEADAALEWAVEREWESQVSGAQGEIVYRPAAPQELSRRIVGRIIGELASEGESNPLRAAELDRLIETLASGGQATLRGVLCAGGQDWRFATAPRRRGG